MVQPMKVLGSTTKLVGMEFIYGKTVESITASGKTMICQVLVFIFTKMEYVTTANI